MVGDTERVGLPKARGRPNPRTITMVFHDIARHRHRALSTPSVQSPAGLGVSSVSKAGCSVCVSLDGSNITRAVQKDTIHSTLHAPMDLEEELLV